MTDPDALDDTADDHERLENELLEGPRPLLAGVPEYRPGDRPGSSWIGHLPRGWARDRG